MLKHIDDFLNRTTMYRLVLYELIGLLLVAVALSAFGQLPFATGFLLWSMAWLLGACWLANRLCARLFDAPINVESAYITALILALIISPPAALADARYLSLMFFSSVFAMASKYVLAIGHKHMFNPAAIGVAAAALLVGHAASWWVGTGLMLPWAAIGGWLIVRKIRRADLVWSFAVSALVLISLFAWQRGSSVALIVQRTFLDTALVFFASVMLTEPLTTPPTRRWRVVYGGVVGCLFAPQMHLGSIYSTPELALLAGNVLSYLVSPKGKRLLTLRQKIPAADQIYDFVFHIDKPLAFVPGQYLEWTLEHAHPDSRGNRRYFTIASAPGEKDLRLGVKFYPQGSTFKKCLRDLPIGGKLIAGQLSGDFTLPHDTRRKLVFIAGGIGVTPFRSMLKDLLERHEKRDTVFFYSNKKPADIAYADIFDQAKIELGIKVIYALSDVSAIPADWTGRVGSLDGALIKEAAPDYLERTFYLSGPHAMVTAFDHILRALGVPRRQIKKDFFPGFV